MNRSLLVFATVAVAALAACSSVPVVTQRAARAPFAQHKASVFEALNSTRSAVGANPLAQSSPLDLAADEFASYMVKNPATLGAIEKSGTPGYAHASLAQRVAAAGYEGRAMGQNTGGIFGADGPRTIEGVLSLGYSTFLLLGPSKDIGIGVATQASGDGNYLVLTFGATAGGASGDGAGSVGPESASVLAHYPYSNQTNVLRTGGLVGKNNSPGHEIAVWLPDAVATGAKSVPELTGFALLNSRGVAVPAIVYGPRASIEGALEVLADPARILVPGQAMLVPASVLEANATYTATVQFGGAPPVQWSFTTGN